MVPVRQRRKQKGLAALLLSVLAVAAQAATPEDSAPAVPAEGSRQRDAVAAAYALRTPERADRFADGWAFAKSVYVCGLSGEASTNLAVLAYDAAKNPDGRDAAMRDTVRLLEPGDLVVSDGTHPRRVFLKHKLKCPQIRLVI